MKALLIGKFHPLLLALPELLYQAGFIVDVIASSRGLQYSRFIRNYSFVPSEALLIPCIVEKLKESYEWIVITEDTVLQQIKTASFSLQEKLRLLPVLKEENLVHLYSKIGLSEVFKEHDIPTPPFVVAHDVESACVHATALGYPVLFKKDASSGGMGIYECACPDDVLSIHPSFFCQPILIQKKIEGEVLDLSAIFLDTQLVHFNYARQEKVCMPPFGPSYLRTYRPIASIEPILFHQLCKIGKALGVHGFTNITCIREKDGAYFFVEADVRPNVWIHYPKFWGENVPLRIREWFLHKKILSPPTAEPIASESFLLPYCFRMKLIEVLCNRYGVWRYIPWKEWRVWLFCMQEESFVYLKDKIFRLIKILVPSKYHLFLKKIRAHLHNKIN